MSYIVARRLTRSAGAAAFALTASLSVPALAKSKHLGDRPLKPGMRGHDVRVLQDYLSKAGFPTPVIGVFDPRTERSVRSFERSHHLEADGIVTAPVVRELRGSLQADRQSSASAVRSNSTQGPRASAASDTSSGGVGVEQVRDSTGHRYPGDSDHMGDRILRQGMGGHDVRVLQDYLTRAGYPTTVDGQFGSGTRRRVIAFQHAHHLNADGVVTYAVSRALRAAVGAAERSVTTNAAPLAQATVSHGLASAPANAPAAVKAVIAAGNKIAFKPYIYGGGHGSWSDSGYDCSGSVSYALHGAHLIASPEDSSELESYGSPGRGRWISIWANSGHTYMYVAGLRFDTSAQRSTGGSRWTTASRSNGGFVERHPTGL